MHRTITPVALSLTSLALLISAVLPGSSSAAPLPHAAARPLPMQAPSAATLAASARTTASPDAATPTVPFQAVGQFSDLAVVSTAQLLTVATFLHTDSGFSGVFETEGLALSPTTGKIYVVGFDGTNSILGQVDWSTGNETTIGMIPGEVIVDIAFDGSGNLYGLTDNGEGTDQHALLSINTATAAASVAKVLDPHGGHNGDFAVYGALAFNSADNSLYYADRDSSFKLFIDKLAPVTFAQTAELSGGPDVAPSAMAFSQGSLWINSFSWYSADAANLGAGVTGLGSVSEFPTPDGLYGWQPVGIFPSTLACIPSATAACLGNRFKVEVSYNARPHNGSGPGNVVLESAESVKFTFFDPSNIEMILKILDACTLNHKWWVFAGGLTNVGVTIKVTDTSTGAVNNYSSSKGKQFQAFSDTVAFPCP